MLVGMNSNSHTAVNIKLKLGQRVKSLRHEQKISQEELAARSGLDRTYLAGIESGKRNPTIESIQKVASGLGISLAQFFEADDFKGL